MGELRFVSLDSAADPDAVTQEAEYETRTHPEGREDDDGNDLAGQEYEEVVEAEQRGTVTYTVVAEASGFSEGERAQIDIGTTGGYRDFTFIDLPAGDEPQQVEVAFAPGPLHLASGQATMLAYRVDSDGNLLDEPTERDDGMVAYPELARLVR